MKKDKEAALEVIRSAIRELVDERVPVEDLVLSEWKIYSLSLTAIDATF